MLLGGKVADVLLDFLVFFCEEKEKKKLRKNFSPERQDFGLDKLRGDVQVM